MTARLSRRPSRRVQRSRVPGHTWVRLRAALHRQILWRLYPDGALEDVGFVTEARGVDPDRWFGMDKVVASGGFFRTRAEAMRVIEDRVLFPRGRLWSRLDDANGTRPWKWVCTDPESLCGRCGGERGALCAALRTCASRPGAASPSTTGDRWSHPEGAAIEPEASTCDAFQSWPTQLRGCWTWGHPLTPSTREGHFLRAVQVTPGGTGGAWRGYGLDAEDRFVLSEHTHAVLVHAPPFGPGLPPNVQLHLGYRGYRILRTVQEAMRQNADDDPCDTGGRGA